MDNLCQQIMVSLIIPLYMVEARIQDTLRDIENQTSKDFEVILIDDCSRDRSLNKAITFLRCRNISVRAIVNSKNIGASASRNRGIKAALGKYVICFDSDDRMDPEFIAEMVREAERSSAELVFCGFSVKNILKGDHKNYLPKYYSWKNNLREVCTIDYLKGHRWLNASNVIYRSDLLYQHEILFTDGCRFAEDREFIIKALYHSTKIGYVPKVLSHYIQHPDQSTRKMKKDISKYAHGVGVYLRLNRYFRSLNETNLAKMIIRQIDNFELPNAYLKMVCSFAAMQDKRRYIKSTQSKVIRKALKQAWKCITYKPEVSFKALLFFFFPEKLYQSYSKKA